MRILLAVLLACLWLQTAQAGTPLPEGPHLVVPGEATVHAAPDRVRIALSVTARAARPDAAKQAADAAVTRYLAVLGRHGVASEDVTASSLRLTEDSDVAEDGRRVSHGFVAERDVTALVQGTDRFNTIVDDGLAAGMTDIDAITFESSRADALRRQARDEAAADSTRRAHELAAAYGARLGSVYSINSVQSGLMNGYGGLDRVQVTGSRLTSRYLQPRIEFTERVQAVFGMQP